jgi:signal transduction histidine kinase
MPHTVRSKNRIRGYLLNSAVLLIALLLLGNAYLLYINSKVIEYNKSLQEEAERVKVNTLDIIRTVHQLDMGLRGYALIFAKRQEDVIVDATNNNTRIFLILEKALQRQQYPMQDFYNVRDSINTYFSFVAEIKPLIDQRKMDEFLVKLREDRGYYAWLTFDRFSRRLNRFEDSISQHAQADYKLALRNSYLLQIVLFFITIPTLAYTAFQTVKALKITDTLRKIELEKNEILAQQKQALEEQVQERTREILAQNEEITVQHEEIRLHNEQLQIHQDEIEKQHQVLTEQNLELLGAKRTIEEQHEIIQRKNNELELEVENRTQDLQRTNAELIEYNSRLEQFTYIISHNLRAPLARLVGLSSVLNFAEAETDKTEIVHLMVKSTSELDNVIKDLSKILAIQKLSTQVYSEIDLLEVIQKVSHMLDEEIRETNAELVTRLDITVLYSLPQYIESIVYNLISNAIKYRHPSRRPCITIACHQDNEFIRIDVSDNGLGFEVDKHKKSLFNLYKRLHFHVEGKGLGLYLVRTQVESLGGRIEVTSEVNTGTTFSVFLKP